MLRINFFTLGREQKGKSKDINIRKWYRSHQIFNAIPVYSTQTIWKRTFIINE